MTQRQKEIAAINNTFKNRGVGARYKIRFVAPSFYLYGLEVSPNESIARVEKEVPQLSLALTLARGRQCAVRLQHPPVMLEVPRMDPQAIPWPGMLDNRAHEMSIGRGFEWGRASPQVIALDDSPHTIIAGMTGSGKSVLEVGAVLSLAMKTPPDELELMLIDLKNDDLVPLRNLPHVIQFATNPDDAMQAVEYVSAESARRRDSQRRDNRRIVIVIDELAQLPPDGLELLNGVLSLGRSQRLNIISATQHPTAEIMGGSVGKINYTTRLVGRVSDATAAATASGRGKTGAEFLPGKGSFLRIEGPDLVRFQAFNLTHDDVDRIVGEVVAKWGGRPAQPVPVPNMGIDADPLADVFTEYHDGHGNLARGGISAALRAKYGNDAATTGRRYQDQRDAILVDFQQWL